METFEIGDLVLVTATREQLDKYFVNEKIEHGRIYKVTDVDTQLGLYQLSYLSDGWVNGNQIVIETLPIFSCDLITLDETEFHNYDDLDISENNDLTSSDELLYDDEKKSLDYEYEYNQLLERFEKLYDDYKTALRTIKEMSKLLDEE